MQTGKYETSADFKMGWLFLSFLCLANASELQGRDPRTLPPVSYAVRMGAAIASRFLRQDPSEFPFPGFYVLGEEVRRRGGGEGAGAELISGLLRLMDVDSRKIKEFAFDGFISLLHLMSEVLLGDDGEQKRKGRGAARDFPVFRFILSQPQVVDLLRHVQDPRLVDLILEESEEKENAECIQLLVCKTKPFVRGMQRSLRFFMSRENVSSGDEEACRGGGEDARWEKADVEARMYFFVPSLAEVIEEGDECDRRFPDCLY